CRLSTGDSFVTRKKYTDFEEARVSLCRPIILSGIENSVRRGDLLDRAVMIELEPISPEKRDTAEGMRAKIDAARPRLFGALLDLLAGGMRLRGQVKLTRNVRMSDLVQHAEECFVAAGKEPGWFPGLFEKMTVETVTLPLGDWPVFQYLTALLAAGGGQFR